MTAAIALAVIVSCAVLAAMAGLRFRRVCLLFASVALALAVSPLDFMVRETGRPRIRLLRTNFGLSCPPDHACYGCIVPLHAPSLALVINY